MSQKIAFPALNEDKKKYISHFMVMQNFIKHLLTNSYK